MEYAKNKKLLNSFIHYCNLHQQEDFWEALTNWSKADVIGISRVMKNKTEVDTSLDTYIFKVKINKKHAQPKKVTRDKNAKHRNKAGVPR